jgi:hypothetical protein
MKRFLIVVVLLSGLTFPLLASDFRIQKQKLKLALEYEDMVGIQQSGEIATGGVRASYLVKASGNVDEKIFLNLDYITGAKAYFQNSFDNGELSPFAWSNRLSAIATVPVGKFFLGGSLYFRNKWLAEVTDEQEFVDVFGGDEYREITGGLQAGFSFPAQWSFLGSVQVSDLKYAEFVSSNSSWSGTSFRVSRKIRNAKINFDYQVRSIDFNRPVPVGIESVTQQDSFREIGASVEYLRTIYFTGGYSYQDNRSNNPGFSYNNHRIALLVGTELSHQFHLQAYGILQNLDFPVAGGELPFPILLNENDHNTLAVSLTRTITEKQELEFTFQRLTHDSSFAELDASKNILLVAYNYRF